MDQAGPFVPEVKPGKKVAQEERDSCSSSPKSVLEPGWERVDQRLKCIFGSFDSSSWSNF